MGWLRTVIEQGHLQQHLLPFLHCQWWNWHKPIWQVTPIALFAKMSLSLRWKPECCHASISTILTASSLGCACTTLALCAATSCKVCFFLSVKNEWINKSYLRYTSTLLQKSYLKLLSSNFLTISGVVTPDANYSFQRDENDLSFAFEEISNSLSWVWNHLFSFSPIRSVLDWTRSYFDFHENRLRGREGNAKIIIFAFFFTIFFFINKK